MGNISTGDASIWQHGYAYYDQLSSIGKAIEKTPMLS